MNRSLLLMPLTVIVAILLLMGLLVTCNRLKQPIQPDSSTRTGADSVDVEEFNSAEESSLDQSTGDGTAASSSTTGQGEVSPSASDNDEPSSNPSSATAARDSSDGEGENITLEIDDDFTVEIARVSRKEGRLEIQLIATYAQGRSFVVQLRTGSCDSCYEPVGTVEVTEFVQEFSLTSSLQPANPSGAPQLRIVNAEGDKVVSTFPE